MDVCKFSHYPCKVLLNASEKMILQIKEYPWVSWRFCTNKDGAHTNVSRELAKELALSLQHNTISRRYVGSVWRAYSVSL